MKRIATPRQEDIVWRGVRELALWYCAGYFDGARGVPSRYSEVPQRHPEASMMYADGYEDGKAGRPHMVGQKWTETE